MATWRNGHWIKKLFEVVLSQLLGFAKREGKEWGVSLVMIKGESNTIGLSLADVIAEGDIEILAIDRAGASIPRPEGTEKILEGDRLLAYGRDKSVKQLLG